MRRCIITGSPGAGKTAISRQLELDEFSVVEEAATDVIAAAQAQDNPEPWTDASFIDAIVSLQKNRQMRGCCQIKTKDPSTPASPALNCARVPPPLRNLERCGLASSCRT